MLRALVMAVLMLAIAAPVGATSPLVDDLYASMVRYHENPGHIDVLRAGLTEAARNDPSVDNLVALAHVCFLWGDVRATTSAAKLEAYEQGREAAKRAVELAPRNVLAHFWYGTNTGRWGQTRGVVSSLFLLPAVKQEIETVLALDPSFPPAYALAGNVYYEVPAVFGGDLDRAERMFRQGLALAPRFTAMRVGLAKTLIKKGRLAEARQQLQTVLDETSPDNPADWTMKDSPRARALLASIRERS
jgi:tetratricopeptide (TPR) repeat protein